VGYTHYWRREPEIPQDKFDAICEDTKKIIEACNEAGIRIRNGHGEDEPIITPDLISFNGDANCGHVKRDLGITWPGENASGASENGETDGDWFAGALLATRTCGGDCSHETAYMPRVFEPSEWNKPDKGLYFAFCKTAFKPYDLAVTAFLIVCKHHLGKKINISSDGEDKDWFDAKMLCDKLLGYGLGYGIDDKEGDLKPIKIKTTSN
jgi:hypothetical protein